MDQLELTQSMMGGLDLSLSSLLAGFVFGVFGIYFFRYGRRDGNPKLLTTGIVLMAYPLFVSNPWMNWGIGSVLTVYGFCLITG